MMSVFEICNINKSFFNSQLFGIIVGAILTAGFTWFIEWRKTVKEQKDRLRENRKDTYLAILKILYLLRNECLNFNNKDISAKRKEEIDNFYPSINVYASKKVLGKYNHAAKKINLFYENQKKDYEPVQDVNVIIDDLITTIRKELGVKD